MADQCITFNLQPMEFYKNYMADAVVRVDGLKRFIKTLDYKNGQEEFENLNPKSKIAFGGEGFGGFYILEPITKEDYETFNLSWTFGDNGEKKPL